MLHRRACSLLVPTLTHVFQKHKSHQRCLTKPLLLPPLPAVEWGEPRWRGWRSQCWHRERSQPPVDTEVIHYWEAFENVSSVKKWVKPTLTPHHVHDGEDVGLHIIAAVVFDEFGVGHHHGLHPALSADWALWPGLRLILPPLLLPLPFLPLPLHPDGVAESIYSTDEGRNHTTLVAYPRLTYTHLCAHTQTSAVLYTYIKIRTLNSTGAGRFSGLCAAFCSVIFWSNSWIDNVGLWSLCRIIRIIRRLLDRFNEKVSFWQGEEASLRNREMRNRWICIKQKCVLLISPNPGILVAVSLKTHLKTHIIRSGHSTVSARLCL